MKRTTTLELAADYKALADKSSHKNGLWKGAYEWTARILRTYHRARAEDMLRRLANRYQHMAISSVFRAAANTLAEQ